MLDDAALLAALESTALPPAAFGHREHVRVAWHLLSTMSFGAAGDRLSAALRRFAGAHDRPMLFHATITWAYLALVNERRLAGPPTADFEAFARAHPELLDHRGGAFAACYHPDELAGPLARATLVLPRRHGHGATMPGPSTMFSR